MKDPRISALRSRAERDLTISDGSLRLLLCLLSDYGRKNKAWNLTTADAADLCGIADQKSVRRRFLELVTAGYIVKAGQAGCPPKNLYFWP